MGRRFFNHETHEIHERRRRQKFPELAARNQRGADRLSPFFRPFFGWFVCSWSIFFLQDGLGWGEDFLTTKHTKYTKEDEDKNSRSWRLGISGERIVYRLFSGLFSGGSCVRGQYSFFKMGWDGEKIF